MPFVLLSNWMAVSDEIRRRCGKELSQDLCGGTG